MCPRARRACAATRARSRRIRPWTRRRVGSRARAVTRLMPLMPRVRRASRRWRARTKERRTSMKADRSRRHAPRATRHSETTMRHTRNMQPARSVTRRTLFSLPARARSCVRDATSQRPQRPRRVRDTRTVKDVIRLPTSRSRPLRAAGATPPRRRPHTQATRVARAATTRIQAPLEARPRALRVIRTRRTHSTLTRRRRDAHRATALTDRRASHRRGRARRVTHAQHSRGFTAPAVTRRASPVTRLTHRHAPIARPARGVVTRIGETISLKRRSAKAAISFASEERGTSSARFGAQSLRSVAQGNARSMMPST